MEHDQTFRAGLFAGYQGVSPLTACPYSAEREREQRTKWLAGYTAGLQQRRLDVLHGRNSDLTPRSEFGVERGHRAGKSIVGRST